MPNVTVTDEEFVWREWVLGEGRYRGRGSRSRPRPNVGYGDPSKGQRPVPQEWWQRLEAFLAKRDDHAEPPRENPEPPSYPIRRADGDQQLSPNFRLSEFNCKDGTVVPAKAVPALVRLSAAVLEPLRRQFGRCTVMSGYRHSAYNRRIGGARFSQHIYDLGPESVAADLIFARGSPREWYFLADQLLARGGVGRYPSFVHVDNREQRARW